MRNLIKADLQRILRKKSIWLTFIFMVAFVTGMIFHDLAKVPDKSFGFVTTATDSLSYVAVVLGIVLVVNVYADDFKSTAYINVVGRGVNRLKFIIAKFLDAVILLVGMYVCAGALLFGLQAALGLSFTSMEIAYVFWYCVGDIIITAACLSIASLLFYVTGNNALGILAFFGVNMIIPVAIEFIKIDPTVAKFHLDRFYVDGAASSMVSDFMMGQVGAGLLKLFLILAVYVAAAIVGSIVLFRKKELDF